jgi:hypothetical protein
MPSHVENQVARRTGIADEHLAFGARFERLWGVDADCRSVDAVTSTYAAKSCFSARTT